MRRSLKDGDFEAVHTLTRGFDLLNKTLGKKFCNFRHSGELELQN